MWFAQYQFDNKQDGLTGKIPQDFLSKPLNDIEKSQLIEFRQKFGGNDVSTDKDFDIPIHLLIPSDFEQLLRFSNGGHLTNGKRELGYFSLAKIREMYLAYDFLRWDKYLMPIGFDGGGTFFAYDFSQLNLISMSNPPIYAVPASCIGDKEEYGFLGKNLATVMQNPISIDEQIYCLKFEPNIEKNLLLAEIADITQKMQKLEHDKLNKAIDLKSYYHGKKRLTEQLKAYQQKLAKHYE